MVVEGDSKLFASVQIAEDFLLAIRQRDSTGFSIFQSAPL